MKKAISKWFFGWLHGGPHFVIGTPDNPYLLRWYIIPRNNWLSIYLHKFLRDDEDRALHDHPWWFLSWMVKGGYEEVVYEGFLPVRRRWLSLALRRPTHRHRVRLLRDAAGKMLPCWTFVVTGPRVREWGFWCPQGFIHWEKFTAPGEPGQVGPGCDQ